MPAGLQLCLRFAPIHCNHAGVVLQRALLLALLTCLPLMLLYWQALPVLLLLGQEGALAADAARYTRIFAAKIPLHAVALCLYRTLAAQGAAAHVLAASAAYCGVTAPINWALISWLDWGLDGSAAAAVACEAGGLLCCHAMPQEPAGRHAPCPCHAMFCNVLPWHAMRCPSTALPPLPMQCMLPHSLPHVQCTTRSSRAASGGGVVGAGMPCVTGPHLPSSVCRQRS